MACWFKLFGKQYFGFRALGLVFHRAPECVYHDVLPGGHAAAVLYGHRALEEKCAAGGYGACVPGGAFHACLREPDGVGEVGKRKLNKKCGQIDG